MRHHLQKFANADFSRGASFWKESLWVTMRCLFFATSWPFPSAFKVFLLRLFGAQIGEGVVIRSQVNIHFPWKLQIGSHSWIGEGVKILNLDRVTIGSDVCISQDAFLCTGSHDHRKENFDLITRPIQINDSAWIAARAFVAPGVTIGAGAIVSAGAIVFESVAEDTLVRGNPASTIRSLPS